MFTAGFGDGWMGLANCGETDVYSTFHGSQETDLLFTSVALYPTCPIKDIFSQSDPDLIIR